MQNIKIDESAILKKARSGNLEAMDMLIVRYQDRIYNTILKICQNPDDALELTQDTFVKAIEQLHNFQGRSSFYTWIFRIGVNLTLNFCKRRFRVRFESIDAENETNSEAVSRLRDYLADDSQVEPDQLAQNREIYNLITQAISKLDDNQRAAIVLCDMEHMSYAQISEVLGIEIGTVKSRISRARSNLRDQLETLI